MDENNSVYENWFSSNNRYWYLISLLSLSILLTLIVVLTEPARRRARAVRKLNQYGDKFEFILYDFHVNPKGGMYPNAKPNYFVNIIGKDYFHNVISVDFGLVPPAKRKKVDDKALFNMEALPNLLGVNLWGCNITDKGLIHLRGLRHLEGLVLNFTPIGDEGLKHISNLPSLKRLMLTGTQITDEGLKHLYGLSSLKTISLSATRVTEQGVKDLQAKLPNAQIDWVEEKK